MIVKRLQKMKRKPASAPETTLAQALKLRALSDIYVFN